MRDLSLESGSDFERAGLELRLMLWLRLHWHATSAVRTSEPSRARKRADTNSRSFAHFVYFTFYTSYVSIAKDAEAS